MPWKETGSMDQRRDFIHDYLRGRHTKKELCMHYGISRPTGDKWIARFLSHGLSLRRGWRRTPAPWLAPGRSTPR